MRCRGSYIKANYCGSTPARSYELYVVRGRDFGATMTAKTASRDVLDPMGHELRSKSGAYPLRL